MCDVESLVTNLRNISNDYKRRILELEKVCKSMVNVRHVVDDHTYEIIKPHHYGLFYINHNGVEIMEIMNQWAGCRCFVYENLKKIDTTDVLSFIKQYKTLMIELKSYPGLYPLIKNYSLLMRNWIALRRNTKTSKTKFLSYNSYFLFYSIFID